jgi:phosphate transport system protein
MPRYTLTQATLAVEEHALQLAALVQSQLARACATMGHYEAADQVPVWEGRVNELRDQIQTEIAQTLEHWAPLGPALRYLMALYAIADECERIGDYAMHVARDLPGINTLTPELMGLVQAMTRLVRDQMHLGVRLLAQTDDAALTDLDAGERQLDTLRHQLVAALQTEMTACPAHIAPAIPILFVVRDLERIGDRIINIARDVIYARTGIRPPRHP